MEPVHFIDHILNSLKRVGAAEDIAMKQSYSIGQSLVTDGGTELVQTG